MKEISIHPQATIKEAMELLDKTAEKTLLVLNEDQKLVGSLTDGDIRRCILKGQELTDNIDLAYKKNPVFIRESNFDREKLKKIFVEKKINLIPILNQDNDEVIDYVTWGKIWGNDKNQECQKLDVPVVIMAGGRGTRLEPFTKILPKPLVPVGEKPIIDHIIDRFRACGINNFFLTVHHMSKIIKAYFEEKIPSYNISFIEEEQPLGTAGSLKYLSGIFNDSFFVSNCDIIIETDYIDLYNFHKNNKHDITLVASAKEYLIPYGICELNGEGSLKCINEKPAYNFLVNTGMYILNPDVLNLIPENEIFHITHLIERVRELKGTIGVYPVSEKAWIDIGQWSEYRRALKIIEGIR